MQLVAVALCCRMVFITPAPAAAQHGAASFVDSGTLTFVTDQVPTDIDPANNEVAGSDVVARNVSEPLVELDGSSLSTFRPVLATSWTTNADKSVWTLTLRHGVIFHTGRCCLTSDDVKYAIVRDIRAGLVNSSFWPRFITKPETQIVTPDPYTVVFNLGKPQPLFIDEVSSLYLGEILDSKALKAHVTKADPWAHTWAQTADIGTGPYVIKSWQHNQQVTLVRFPGYWGGWSGRHFGTVIMQTVPEGATRRELVEKGQADITFDLTPEDNLALQHNPAVKVVAPYGTEVQYAYMTQYGPLASPYARQALSYAMNYTAVVNVYKGFARRAYGCLPSTMLGYDPNIFHYNTDLNKAKALLQKAGVKPGTTLTYWSYTAPENLNGEILQAQLAQIGITLKVQLVTESALTSVYYGSAAPSKRPNLIAFGWWPDFNDPWDECNVLLNSAAAGPAGANAGYYHDSTVDALLNKMENADTASLVDLAHKMQAAQAADPAAIWMDEPAQVTILAKNLQGYVFNPVKLQTYGFYTMYRS
jgi:peptide/nickel transport system substrate-binding protein